MSVFKWPVRVYYEDTDRAGVVYYANYLRFMERARTEWLRGLGIEQDSLSEQQGIVFAVRSASLEFIKPAHFNDLLEVGAEVIKRGRASLTFSQAIDRQGERQGEPSEIVCTGIVKIACLDAVSLQPKPIPEFVLKEIPDVD